MSDAKGESVLCMAFGFDGKVIGNLNSKGELHGAFYAYRDGPGPPLFLDENTTVAGLLCNAFYEPEDDEVPYTPPQIKVAQHPE